MNPEWQKYLDCRVPRYTSFPSALFFDDRVNPQIYADAFAKIAPYEPLSLYTHVPFCKQLCWYCGCNMMVENDYKRAQRYTDSLIRELGLVAEKLAGRGEVVSIHFGGGTPNYLAENDLARIFDAIESNLGLTDKAHISMELDPRHCPPGLISALIGYGVDRFSLGVQDFDIRVQTSINRIQPYQLVEQCVAEMRTHTVSDINFDLLYGLPLQSRSTFQDTLEKTISLSPDRVSLFGYAHLPSKLRHQRMINDADLPDYDMRFALAQQADEFLVDHGYLRVGFDHFAKPANSLGVAASTGKLRRNFQGFTDDIAESVIGLGVSAISLVKGVYAQNEKRTDRYAAQVESGQLATERGWIRTADDEIWNNVITDLLCFMKTDLNSYFPSSAAARPAIMRDLWYRLAPYIEDGLAHWDNGRVSIPEQARPFSRVVAAQFDPYIQSSQKALSRAV